MFQEIEIKKLAAQGNHEGCKTLAKQLIQLRKQRNRTYAANSKVRYRGFRDILNLLDSYIKKITIVIF